jgi:hypothetical protein
MAICFTELALVHYAFELYQRRIYSSTPDLAIQVLFRTGYVIAATRPKLMKEGFDSDLL